MEFKELKETKDFDEFIEKIREIEYTKEIDDILWKNTFSLEKWYLLMKGKGEGAEPFAGQINNKGYFFLFTDLIKMQEFINRVNIVEEQEPNALSFKPFDAVNIISRFLENDIYGIRFNDGEAGWFAPIRKLKSMWNELMVENKSN